MATPIHLPSPFYNLVDVAFIIGQGHALGVHHHRGAKTGDTAGVSFSNVIAPRELVSFWISVLFCSSLLSFANTS